MTTLISSKIDFIKRNKKEHYIMIRGIVKINSINNFTP